MDYKYVVKKNEDWYYVESEKGDSYNKDYILGYIVQRNDPNRSLDFQKIVDYYNNNPDKAYTYEKWVNEALLVGLRKTYIRELEKRDYIGVKIAMGRATIEDYAQEIEYSKFCESEINRIDEELKAL